MILGGDGQAEGDRTTLDDLFRRAGVRHPDSIALADPPNRASFTDGPPRKLTYSQADRAISAMAARLRGLGLQSDTVVAFQLPNTVESVIALLGIMRAGMIAAPLPLLWRRQEIVAALKCVGAKALIANARIRSAAQTTSLADLARQVAAELFQIRHVCGFGPGLPDGVAPLDDVFDDVRTDFVHRPARSGNAAAHVAVVTFEVTADGLCAVARSHIALIAAGAAPFPNGSAMLDAPILSTIPLGSFAGIALTVIPWLQSGGTLNLHHAFDPSTFATQCRDLNGGTIVVPGPVIAPLEEADCLPATANVIALWRSPERLAGADRWRGAAKLIDVSSFGEIGLNANLRGPDGRCQPIALGSFGTSLTAAGTLAMAGAMVPTHAFRPGAAHERSPLFGADEAHVVDTGYACRLDRDGQVIVVVRPPAGIVNVGFYRFRQAQIEAQVAGIDPDATIVAVPSSLLSARLGGSASGYAAIAAQLLASGANPLLVEAFRPRKNAA